ncbi:MAG: nuclear transport factor 2 family protein [Cyanobacteria bacterium P01_G01_bin.54]
MLNEEDRAKVSTAVTDASDRWKAAFNAGDAAGCAAQYEADAVMQARPFGTFKGTEAIQAFWQNLITDGYTDVEYIDQKIEVVDATAAVLTSKWRMNKASGVIHRELWVVQADGEAKLREDDFEAME